jgi:hypothetical protein
LFICKDCDNYENTKNIGINILRKYLEHFDANFDEFLNDSIDCHDIHGYQLSLKQRLMINTFLTKKIYDTFDAETKYQIKEYEDFRKIKKNYKDAFIDD